MNDGGAMVVAVVLLVGLWFAGFAGLIGFLLVIG